MLSEDCLNNFNTVRAFALEFRLHADFVNDSAGRRSPNVYFEDEPGPAIQPGIAVPPCAS